MRNKHLLWPALLGIFLLFGATGAEDIFSDCQQMVVVLSTNDHSVKARLWKFERRGKRWKAVGLPHPVNLGKNGLAWGRGLHSAKPGLQKKEGDKKSPAGIFRFGDAFGYAPTADAGFKLEYVPITESAICVEDPASRYYNQIIDAAGTGQDWVARESMMRQDEQYKWGVFVKHNLPAEAECGSCIFFHLWRKPGSGTLGCTAMSEDKMLELLRWLDPAKKPLLMQMTTADYKAYRKLVNLPVAE